MELAETWAVAFACAERLGATYVADIVDLKWQVEECCRADAEGRALEMFQRAMGRIEGLNDARAVLRDEPPSAITTRVVELETYCRCLRTVIGEVRFDPCDGHDAIAHVAEEMRQLA